jgi:hypothetical protein
MDWLRSFEFEGAVELDGSFHKYDNGCTDHHLKNQQSAIVNPAVSPTSPIKPQQSTISNRQSNRLSHLTHQTSNLNNQQSSIQSFPKALRTTEATRPYLLLPIVIPRPRSAGGRRCGLPL